jgi:hypothetical protein
MSELTSTTQDTFRDHCIEAYVGLTSFVHDLVERARRSDGQTAAEYMGVLLVVSVIIAGVATTNIGHDIVTKMSDLVTKISTGTSGKGS